MTESEFSGLKAYVESLDKNIAGLTQEVRQLQSDVSALKQDTAEIVEYFKALQGFFRVLELIGKLGRPLIILAIVGTIIAAQWTNLKKLF